MIPLGMGKIIIAISKKYQTKFIICQKFFVKTVCWLGIPNRREDDFTIYLIPNLNA